VLALDAFTASKPIIPSLQEVLSTLATAVASSTQALITHAQKIASLSEDQAMKDKIYAAIKETADATQGLLTAANMVGSSADYSLCQEQLTEACKKAIGKVEKLVLTAQVSQVERQRPAMCHKPPHALGRYVCRSAKLGISGHVGHAVNLHNALGSMCVYVRM